jgi:hypothetical protein
MATAVSSHKQLPLKSTNLETRLHGSNDAFDSIAVTENPLIPLKKYVTITYGFKHVPTTGAAHVATARKFGTLAVHSTFRDKDWACAVHLQHR